MATSEQKNISSVATDGETSGPSAFAFRLSRFLTGSNTIWWGCLAGAILSIPALWGGLQLDDHQESQILRNSYPFSVTASWHTELFTFGDGIARNNQEKRDAGIYPWWCHPDFKCTFSRPLAALTHALDYRLWPDSTALMHLHSIGWYAIAIAGVGLFYRRVFPTAWGAGAAVLLFAVDDIHSVTVVWLANRNALISMALASAAMYAHVRGRQTRTALWLVAAPILLLLGLLAGETAVSAGAFLLAYALMLDRGSLRERLLSLIPCAAVGAGWYLNYRRLGFGAAHSLAYVDPGADPLNFLWAVFQRVPVFLSSAFGAMGSELWLFASPWAQNVMLVYCWVVLLLLLWSLWPLLRRDQLLRFWGVCLILSILPCCTAMVMDRVLIMVTVASAAFVGRWAELLLMPPETFAGFVPSKFARVSFGIYAFIAVAVSIPLFPLRIESWTDHERSMISTACSPALSGDNLPQQDLLTFGLPDPMYGWHLSTIRGDHGLLKPRTSRLLTTGLTAARLTRPDADTLTVSVPEGVMLHPMSQLWSDLRPPYRGGDRIELPRITLTINAVSSKGDPTEFSCRCSVPLEDKSLLWTRWENDRLVPLELPAIGEAVELSATKIWTDYSAGTLLNAMRIPPVNRATVTRIPK